MWVQTCFSLLPNFMVERQAPNQRSPIWVYYLQFESSKKMFRNLARVSLYLQQSPMHFSMDTSFVSSIAVIVVLSCFVSVCFFLFFLHSRMKYLSTFVRILRDTFS